MCPQHYITTKIIDRRQGGSMFHVIYTKQLNIGAEIETRQHFSNLMWSNFSEWSVSFSYLAGVASAVAHLLQGSLWCAARDRTLFLTYCCLRSCLLSVISQISWCSVWPSAGHHDHACITKGTEQHILWDIMCTTALLIAVTTHLPQTTSVMKNDKVNDKVKEFKNTT